MNWLTEKGLTPNEYYLVVGRFVPENNVETIIREFMASDTTKDLAIITTENPKLYAELEEKLHFSADPRIKFVGTVYDQELLKKIRENAWAYIHGHQVGGTNPSLLEALARRERNTAAGRRRGSGMPTAGGISQTDMRRCSLRHMTDRQGHYAH